MKWLKQINFYRRQSKSTYKKLTCITKHYLKKAPNNMKTPEKTGKAVRYFENQTKDSKDTNKILKGKIVNAISEIQVSDSDQIMDTFEHENNSMVWRSLPNMVTHSEDSGSSDNDGTKCVDDGCYVQNHTISNLEYTELTLSNFAVKLFSTKPITAPFHTGATC